MHPGAEPAKSALPCQRVIKTEHHDIAKERLDDREEAREARSRQRGRQSLQQFLESGHEIHVEPPCSE